MKAPLPHMCNISGLAEEAVCSCPNAAAEAAMSPLELLAHCEELQCLNGGMYMTLSSGHCGCVCPEGYKAKLPFSVSLQGCRGEGGVTGGEL